MIDFLKKSFRIITHNQKRLYPQQSESFPTVLAI